jgi:hypothetical protein
MRICDDGVEEGEEGEEEVKRKRKNLTKISLLQM